MIFWHVGATVAIVRYVFRDERMDLRFLVLGALAPTIVDAPVGALFYERLGSLHLAAHSLLVSTGVMTAVLLATRRGRPRKRWMPVAVGMLVHLLLDGMWSEPETLWWPFLGWSFTPAEAATAAGAIGDMVTDPVIWVLEAVGLVYLVGLARKASLRDSEKRRRFYETGRLDARISP